MRLSSSRRGPSRKRMGRSPWCLNASSHSAHLVSLPSSELILSDGSVNDRETLHLLYDSTHRVECEIAVFLLRRALPLEMLESPAPAVKNTPLKRKAIAGADTPPSTKENPPKGGNIGRVFPTPEACTQSSPMSTFKYTSRV